MKITQRPLASFQECCAHYPSKTLSAAVKALRSRLLPVIRDWVESRNGPLPRYDETANEIYHLKRLSTKVRDKLNSEWLGIESRLRPIYGNALSSSHELLDLLSKGCSLFARENRGADSSFSALVGRAIATDSLPPDLVSDLEHFRQLFMSDSDSGNLELKSFIHQIADVNNVGACKLKRDTLHNLHEHQRDFVENMADFRPQPNLLAPPRDRFDFDPTLHKLIDHNIFKKFRFLSLN